MMTRKQDESRGGSNWNEQLQNPSFSGAGPWPSCAAPPPTSGIPSPAQPSPAPAQPQPSSGPRLLGRKHFTYHCGTFIKITTFQDNYRGYLLSKKIEQVYLYCVNISYFQSWVYKIVWVYNLRRGRYLNTLGVVLQHYYPLQRSVTRSAVGSRTQILHNTFLSLLCYSRRRQRCCFWWWTIFQCFPCLG